MQNAYLSDNEKYRFSSAIYHRPLCLYDQATKSGDVPISQTLICPHTEKTSLLKMDSSDVTESQKISQSHRMVFILITSGSQL